MLGVIEAIDILLAVTFTVVVVAIAITPWQFIDKVTVIIAIIAGPIKVIIVIARIELTTVTAAIRIAVKALTKVGISFQVKEMVMHQEFLLVVALDSVELKEHQQMGWWLVYY